jgi:pilus assembly protein FimV
MGTLDFSSAPMRTPAAAPEAPTFDLSDISLDLDLPTEAPTRPAARVGEDAHDSTFGAMELPPLDDVNEDPLSRKLELAEEFRQIGDTDGARDLLQEVIARASGSVKTRAQTMLADLG